MLPYYIAVGAGLVETWATEPLNFQPRDWRRQWRDELKRELLSLTSGQRAGAFLAARYESPVRDYDRDVENILFYNVGGAFATSTRNGLRFERLYSCPPACPVELRAKALHYHRYEDASAGGPFHGWEESKLLAEFEGIELPRISSESKPVLAWFPLRDAELPIRAQAEPHSEFALRLQIEIPASAGSAASFAKPLVDGVIAAFQAHDGTNTNPIAVWMTGEFGPKLRQLKPARVDELLADDSMATLGRCRIFKRHGIGFACDPEDHRCVAGELELKRIEGRRGFRLRGELHEVKARQP